MDNEEVKLCPLMDHLVLQKIFCNLTVFELKSARLVCGIWGEEGAINLQHKNISIHLNPNHISYESRLNGPQIKTLNPVLGESYRNELAQFLSQFMLKHTFHLSLLDLPWLNITRLLNEHYYTKNSEGSPQIIEDFYKQFNNASFTQSVILNYIPKALPWIKELRLEMMLKTEQDFQLLELILEAVEQSLERLSIDAVIFSDDLLKRVQPKDHKLSKIKTLAIRLSQEQNNIIWNYWKGREQLLPPIAATNLLSLFPNLSFLDLVGWRQFEKDYEVKNKTTNFLAAASNLNLKLEGFNANPITAQEFSSIKFYCGRVPLKFIYLNILYKENCSILETLDGLLKDQKDSLERFEIIWRPLTPKTDYTLKFPSQGLQRLKSLSFISKVRVILDVLNCFRNENWRTAKLADLFGLQQLFEDSGAGLGKLFPSLQSITILFFGEGSEEMYKTIFPENYKKSISHSINSLVISLIGDCESEEIEKFPKILFPKLKIFRHGKTREGGNKTFVCHHEYDERGKLIGKWEWLANVLKFMGHCAEHRDLPIFFYTALYRFKLNTGDHGFWDTPFDLEEKRLQYGPLFS